MKNLIFVLFALLLSAGSSYAASSATTTVETSTYGQQQIFTTSWIAHTDGTFTSYTISGICGYVLHVTTDPGGTAPTADYDIALNDSSSGAVDIMGGTLTDRSATASEQEIPAIGSSYGPRFVCGDVSLVITNNSVNTALGEVIVYVAL